MATFVHLADERDAKLIRRSGIRAAKARNGLRAVFCVPVFPNFQTTFQWSRELRRSGYRSTSAVQFRIKDSEQIYLGHYREQPQPISAAGAVARFLGLEDPRGYEVLIPRSILPSEITHIRAAPYLSGWRYFPEAKGKGPYWPLRDGIKTKRLKERLEKQWSDP